EASSDRVSVLLETEDRPVLLVDAAGEDPAGTRAPVPSPVPAPTVRTTRVPAERVESWIEALVATQAGGQGGGRAGTGAGGRGEDRWAVGRGAERDAVADRAVLAPAEAARLGRERTTAAVRPRRPPAAGP